MKFDNGIMVLSSGRRIPVIADNVLGLGLDNVARMGYDGDVDEMIATPLTLDERSEIAEEMVKRWAQWGALVMQHASEQSKRVDELVRELVQLEATRWGGSNTVDKQKREAWVESGEDDVDCCLRQAVLAGFLAKNA